MLNGANLLIQTSSPHRGFTPVSDTHHWASCHILRPPFPHPHSPVCCFLFQSISQIPTRCSSLASIQMLRRPTGQLQSQLRGLSPLSPTSHSPCQRVTSPRRALPGGFHWLWHQAHIFWGVFQGSTILGGQTSWTVKHTRVLPALAPTRLPSWGCSASPTLLSQSSHSSRPSSSLTSSLKTW